MEKKINKRERFEDIIAMLNGESVSRTDTATAIEVLKHEIELLAKKNSSVSKAKQKQNAEDDILRTEVADFLSEHPHSICTDISNYFLKNGHPEMNTSKMSALLKPMIADGSVIREVVKNKAQFSLAE